MTNAGIRLQERKFPLDSKRLASPMESGLIRELLFRAHEIVTDNASWMGWNLFLAIVPVVLSIFLFRQVQLGNSGVTVPSRAVKKRHRSILWWLGTATFVAFLPNAPYILTDIIHFIDDVQAEPSVWIVTLIFVPLYVLFLSAGFEAYVISLINAGAYLKRIGYGRYILSMEIILHFLSAIGIYLGRFLRFNSWDILTRPGYLAMRFAELLDKPSVLTIALTCLILMGLYKLLKPVHLALASYWQRRPQSRSLNPVGDSGV